MMSNNNPYNCTITDVFKKTILKTELDFLSNTSSSFLNNNNNDILNNNNNGNNTGNGTVAGNGSPSFSISRMAPPITLSPKLQQIYQQQQQQQQHTSGSESNNIVLTTKTTTLTTTTTTTSTTTSTSLSPPVSPSSSSFFTNFQPIKLFIGDSRKSTIYVLVTISIATISNCHDCTIILGPCCDYLEICDCSSLTIISITKGIRLKTSSNINVNICTNQKPIINSDCNNIKLAPYNTYYPTLECHLLQSKLLTNLSNNLWSTPLVFNSTSDSTTENNQNPNINNGNEFFKDFKQLNLDGKGSGPIYSIVDPDEFYSFTIPFNLKGKTKSNPCELPPKYSKSLLQKSTSVQSLHKLIQQSTSDQKLRAHILHLIESRFHQWLLETDNIRQINDLINMENTQTNSSYLKKSNNNQ